MRQNLADFRVPDGFRGRGAFQVQLWWLVQSTLFRMSPQFAYGWRRFLLRLFGAKVGRQCVIRPTATITYPWKLALSDNVWIGDDVTLYTLGQISVGSNSVISQRSYVCAADHDHRRPDFPLRVRPITIGSEVWIAADVFIAPGVSIGSGSVVGARSTVLRDLPANMICVGYPCVPIKDRAEQK